MPCLPLPAPARTRRLLTAATLALSLSTPGSGAQQGLETLPLWPTEAAEVGASPADLLVFEAAPATAVGTAVLVLPGGGYAELALDHEGAQVAAWLNSIGIDAYVLRYRVAPHVHPAPFDDARRALRLLRATAASRGFASHRIGVVGFSAGGHLASMLATRFDLGLRASTDPVDRSSSRPDFAILVYPVITLTGPAAHAGSYKALLGHPEPPPSTRRELSTHESVPPTAPPVFLVHTGEDEAVPAENSLLFFEALRRFDVPAELHVFAEGDHGAGLGRYQPGMAQWPALCADWMRRLGVLGPPAAQPPTDAGGPSDTVPTPAEETDTTQGGESR
ncbi:MAG: alpha/beta hydrolase [Thermoanaerobaculia bacterium]|nr:alpha/beta hydrolase [Thermoanaerobaculia bacterium]